MPATYQALGLIFTSSDSNYNNAQGSGSITINKADSTTTLSGTGTFTYNGVAHAATATVTSADGLNQSVLVFYSGNCSAAPVNVNESPCTVSATYGGDANHNGSSANGTIIITKADASITVSGYTGVYNGFAHGATGPATGVNGENLNASLNLGATFINVPGGMAFWTFTGGINYDANGSIAITIAKADPIVTATGNACTYNGNPCTGSGSATGVKEENLTPVTLAYAITPGPGNLLASAPVNAGSYYVAARYAGDSNYNQKQSAPATITILQAAQTITVTQEPPASAYYQSDVYGSRHGQFGSRSLHRQLRQLLRFGHQLGIDYDDRRIRHLHDYLRSERRCQLPSGSASTAQRHRSQYCSGGASSERGDK